jgi:hypothetical protein
MSGSRARGYARHSLVGVTLLRCKQDAACCRRWDARLGVVGTLGAEVELLLGRPDQLTIPTVAADCQLESALSGLSVAFVRDSRLG